ncbi:DUF4269 domain-containing protein [Arundinibacter roseus]|uniref:DUF4269 domain-containing protein n=1 Tax=Arundinibacter roseus TaxID=2070510 RepID=A0A4R4KFV3_9BACT|nr:DUF4269 domain-containing protein [Arundinibacter roseus]TDB66894.1 DUF4269 domain-containing protein [Arundinibacter roseus]
MEQRPFFDLSYLAHGTQKQQRVFELLTNNYIFEILRPFSPVLTGTIPLDIDTDTSDLDIICCFQESSVFQQLIYENWQTAAGFSVKSYTINKRPTILARFYLDEIPVEIFGQNRPTDQQEAYKHLLIEDHLLKKYGEPFKLQVKELKSKGWKTEPAFAKLLHLEGDPYLALLNMTR